MIIGLVGYIGSGKGTVGDILVREHGYTKFAFADALKDATATIFTWPRGLLEGDSDASRNFRETVDPWWSDKLGYEVTPRLILQKMGTEACRHGIADNIWIAALEKRIHGYQDVVISDVRFPNEVDFVRSAGGVIIRVKRGEEPTDEELSKMHISETAWKDCKLDATLWNESTIEELREGTNKVLTFLEQDSRIQNTIFHHPV
jgi:rhodanese-related sulfurtransferase